MPDQNSFKINQLQVSQDPVGQHPDEEDPGSSYLC